MTLQPNSSSPTYNHRSQSISLDNQTSDRSSAGSGYLDEPPEPQELPSSLSLSSSTATLGPPHTTGDIPLADLDKDSKYLATRTKNMSLADLLQGADYESDLDDDSHSAHRSTTGSAFHNDSGRLAKYTLKFSQFFHRLWQGPIEPKDEPAPRIQSLLYLEEIPLKFKNRISLPYRKALLALYLTFWIALVYSILVPYFTVPPYSSKDPNNNNNSGTKIYSLSCTDPSEFWFGKNAACGMNGEHCPEVFNHLTDPDQDIIIRCPALCDRSWTFSQLPVGDQLIKHRGYFIGGGDNVADKIDPNQLSNPYRADSYPCGSAVHAGLVSPFWGGCARLSYKSGEQSFFKSAKGHYGVDASIAFDSFFKSSFFFKNLRWQGETFTQCNDPRMVILVINIVLGLPIIYLASGAVAYWVLSICAFWTICLATDPRITVDPSKPEDLAALISLGLERFLPTCCILYMLWHCSTKRTLQEPEEPQEPLELQDSDSPSEKVSYLSRVLLFYPLFWLGVLNNVTFDRLPTDRLVWNDLIEQPGAMIAVSSLVTLIFSCAVVQGYKLWLSGRFQKYLFIYSLFVVGLVVVANIPGLTLRIHHYILAMLLIPGCATRGRTALVFQGILLGLFLSGASGWGLASIAETHLALKRNDPSGALEPPLITLYDERSGLLNWQNITTTNAYKKYTSVSLLINDLEEYISEPLQTNINLRSILTNSSTPIYNWIQKSLQDGIKDDRGNIPIYLRLGWKIPNTRIYSDYSKAAVLKWPSGELTLPLPGMT
ncbi:uncharacterized protein LODBEIA_P46360 [Lodderomyces beijingensis]|uniref:LCCL domain-containing protein n=1 Tax=Lodderomyces beijingensis TaxID=1775926 RepID=A0ABP0ZVC6_9ASCO